MAKKKGAMNMVRVAKIERKTEYFPILGGEIKATNDAQGIVEGYLNYFSNIDFGDDRTMPGAFKRTLSDSYARKRQQGLEFIFPYLWNHDYSIPPAGGIFDANEDKKGLYVKVQMNMDTELGRNLYSSFKSGFLKKQSMGYKAIQVEYVKDEATGRTIRNLLEVAVMEGSAVVFPMNDMAQVDTVKNNRRTFYMPNKLPAKQAFPALTKDYAASYAEATQQDWVSDLWNLWYPLKNEIIVAFQTGDTPVEDVQAALTQFGTALISYVQRGVELDMMEYLQPDDNNNSPYDMYMSADDNPDTKEVKAGRVLSAANHIKLTKAADGIHGHVTEIKALLKSAAAQRSSDLQGYPMTMGADDPPQTKIEEEPEDEATRLNKLRALVYDLKDKLQFQNADHGI